MSPPQPADLKRRGGGRGRAQRGKMRGGRWVAMWGWERLNEGGEATGGGESLCKRTSKDGDCYVARTGQQSEWRQRHMKEPRKCSHRSTFGLMFKSACLQVCLSFFPGQKVEVFIRSQCSGQIQTAASLKESSKYYKRISETHKLKSEVDHHLLPIPSQGLISR